MDDAGSAIEQAPDTTPKRRGSGRRLLTSVGGLILIVGLLAFAQQSTGILCGTTLPGFGAVECSEPGPSDMNDWYDARTSQIKAEVAFSKQKTLCEITAIRVGDDAEAAAFGRCMNTAYPAFEDATKALLATSDRLLAYMSAGDCRTAMRRWRNDLAGTLALAKQVSSGSVQLNSSGKLPARVSTTWNRLNAAENASAKAVVAACDD